MAPQNHPPESNRSSGRIDATAQAESRSSIDPDEALRNGWFEMWYQPKIDLKGKCLAGAEALARLHHPRLGILLPAAFLPGAGGGEHLPTGRACLDCGPAQLEQIRRGWI
jgi:predicted signal transduction protein with EAL and GGDEF domain